MKYFRQIVLLALTQIRLLTRNRKAAVFGIILSIAYLVVGTQILIVTFGNRVNIGIFSKRNRVVADVKKVMTKAGINTIRFYENSKGEISLKNGSIAALISVHDTPPPRVCLSLSGKNPMLDSQIAVLLLAATPALSSSSSTGGRPPLRMEVRNIEVDPIAIITFMTASLLPFLIMHLALTYCGQFWIQDFEGGQLFTFLSSPARRETLVAGRTLGAILFMLLNLIITLSVCRFIVTWKIPSQIFLWVLLIIIQIFAATGLNFFFAALCKKFIIYLNVIIVLLFLMAFVSGVFTPVETLPRWEQILAKFTPAFYAVRSMRAVVLGKTPLLLFDFMMLIAWGIGFYICGYFFLIRSTIDSRAKN